MYKLKILSAFSARRLVSVFTVRDLRNNASGLVKNSENGALSLITKHGKPVVITLPFDAKLLEMGLGKALGFYLYEKKVVTLVQASKISGLEVSEFLDVLKDTTIPAVNYPSKELDTDVRNLE